MSDQDFSTVYGQFFVGQEPMEGRVVFHPLHRFSSYVYYQDITAYIDNGILTHNGTPGVSIPAEFFGLEWEVVVYPRNLRIVIQSFPGDIISLGD